MTTITRFCPSPTGYIHFGNLRILSVNHLYRLQQNGEMILRFDDTDTARCKDEYKTACLEDLEWLGIKPDRIFHQSERMDLYMSVFEKLVTAGKIYKCFETPEELETQRNLLLKSGKPPIYRRGKSIVSSDEQQKRDEAGKFHYRFSLDVKRDIVVKDKVFGEVSYVTSNLSDPVIMRENGDFLYSLCSVIDDIDMQVTDIIRGSDHLTNTATQIQMFEAVASAMGVNLNLPSFIHLPLFEMSSGKISKRKGDYSLQEMRHYEPLTLINASCKIGKSNFDAELDSIDSLTKSLNFKNYNTGNAVFDTSLLLKMNSQAISGMSLETANAKLGANYEEEFWSICKDNITSLDEIRTWHEVVYDVNLEIPQNEEYSAVILQIKNYFNGKIDKQNLLDIKNHFKDIGLKPKELWHSLRHTLTGRIDGPVILDIIRIMPDEILQVRLNQN